MADDLERETTELLQRLVRLNTVNPPGNERPAQEYRHMSLELLGQLAHGRDERIDVRDLALAVDCYREVATELLG